MTDKTKTQFKIGQVVGVHIPYMNRAGFCFAEGTIVDFADGEYIVKIDTSKLESLKGLGYLERDGMAEVGAESVFISLEAAARKLDRKGSRIPDWKSNPTEFSEYARAFCIAQDGHFGQKDKVGKDYICHPEKVSEYCKTERGRIAGFLHDIVEDTNYTLDDLRAYEIGEDIIIAVDCITKRKGEKLDDYLVRVASNDIALEVKFADMRHNSDPKRFEQMMLGAESDGSRLRMQSLSQGNKMKYFGRAKQLIKIAGEERAKSLMRSSTIEWFSVLFGECKRCEKLEADLTEELNGTYTVVCDICGTEFPPKGGAK